MLLPSYQELLGPIYFLLIIIILKVALPDPHSEAFLDPPGPVAVTSMDITHGVLAGVNITVAPDDQDTRNFITTLGFHNITFTFLQVVTLNIYINLFERFDVVKDEEAMTDHYKTDPASIFMGIVFNQRDTDLRL